MTTTSNTNIPKRKPIETFKMKSEDLSDDKDYCHEISKETNSDFKSISKKLLSSFWKQVSTREGWIGEYNYAHLFTPDIWPFNKNFENYQPPYFGINDKIPILLTIILGLQHCLTLIISLVSVPLIMGSALNFDLKQTQHLVTCTLITAGIASFAQITRFHIYKTPYYVGTGLLSVVGPTFDVLGIVYAYAPKQYAKGLCEIDSDGNYLPCMHGYGAILGTMLCTVWIQVLVAFIPPRYLKKIFPNMVTGSLLVLLSVYLAGNGMKNWGGGSGCMDSSAGCTIGSYTEPWGSRRFIGLGVLTFTSILIVNFIGSPLMKSSSIIFGLIIGCMVAAACGYWDASGIRSAPAADFMWTENYTYSVDGTLVLPFLLMFIVEGISCIPDILATAEASHQEVDGETFQSRVQGGIMCDALGSLLGAVGGGMPMVSQAANNGVILLTGCASRRAGWFAAFLLILLGLFSKIAATFCSLPSPVFGGMQIFLFGTMGIAGIKVLSTVPWTRRNRFILTAGLGWGFSGCVVPGWFDLVINYQGSNQSLAGFVEGIELIVETPFIFGAIIVFILNLLMPEDTQSGGTCSNNGIAERDATSLIV
ncbi:hypothetical protein OGAPHI_003437 [Ogataea philodendri]|uniref:Purine permease n=1 Tax=Ogataea philodendri TaxID=1378263 RepID=A0A9P8P7N1_9ASCO|nr:uncharacterized protein OGAPHI_003437 [Ogataea philodendri]KAH3666581.1 hypothetical protein OGAPHI_003437 [Ogataea philodendri]